MWLDSLHRSLLVLKAKRRTFMVRILKSVTGWRTGYSQSAGRQIFYFHFCWI